MSPLLKLHGCLEGRGRHGAIWEVLVTYEWLLDQLEALKDRLKDVNYEDVDAPEDYLITNVNLAHCCNGLGRAQPLAQGGIAHVWLPIYAALPTVDSQSTACSPPLTPLHYSIW